MMTLALVKKWRKYRSDITTEFYSHVEELLENKLVMELDKFTHHYCYTRLKHSLDVAYYSFVIARLFHWDSKSVARAALLHDLYFYDRKEDDFDGRHASHHPKIALHNAMEICDLNEREKDIILKHMWLATLKPPRYKEGYIVTFVDKICATTEFTKGVFTRSHLRAVYESAKRLCIFYTGYFVSCIFLRDGNAGFQ